MADHCDAVESDSSISDPYTNWQKEHGLQLFEGGGIWWRLYRGILIPASVKPEPIRLASTDARALLKRSGAHLVRFFSETYKEPSAFWYVACDAYNFESLPGKMRKNIRRAQRDCTVRRLEPAWIAENGYACYEAAFSRYRGARPDSSETFRKECMECASVPFEFWGAFVGNELAAYAKCVVGPDYVTMVAFKFDPKYSHHNATYALQDKLLEIYVTGRGKPVNNGFRSLDHDTNMQEFVLRFGFRRVYTDLKVVYRPGLETIVSLLYPFSSLLSGLGSAGRIAPLRALFKQEQIRRSFA